MDLHFAVESLRANLQDFVHFVLNDSNQFLTITGLFLAIWALYISLLSYRFAKISQTEFDQQMGHVKGQGQELDRLLKAVEEKVRDTRHVMTATRNHVDSVKEMIVDAQEERKAPLGDFGEVLAYTYKAIFEIEEREEVFVANFSAQFGAVHFRNQNIRGSFFESMKRLLDAKFNRWPEKSRKTFEDILASTMPDEEKFSACIAQFRGRIATLASQSRNFHLVLLDEGGFRREFLEELLRVENVYGGNYEWLKDVEAQDSIWRMEESARREIKGRTENCESEGRECVISYVQDVPIQFLLGRREGSVGVDEYASALFFVGSQDLARSTNSAILGIYTRMRRFAEVQKHLHRWMVGGKTGAGATGASGNGSGALSEESQRGNREEQKVAEPAKGGCQVECFGELGG